MYELIISEKPSAAKRIAESLADSKPIKKNINKVPYYELTSNKKDVVVAAAAGHLFIVDEKEKSFTYPSFELEWKPAADVNKTASFSRKYLNVLKKLAKDADIVTVATDYDIEGEVIGLNIVRFACGREDARRMKFSTLTKDDLVEAYSEALNSLDWGQANAGETRHFLDWMYGINLSRALMSAIKEAGTFKIMSIGRVQGPALKMLADKEREIQAFKPEPYWQIRALGEKSGKELESWHESDKFWKEDEAKESYSKVKDADTAKVASLDKNEYKQPAPNPFDLGSLQSESYRHFRLNPKRTLEAAQNLYSAGYISYPRTSSQKLPAKIGYNKILSMLARNPEYEKNAQSLLDKGFIKPNEGKKSDPAHPAIYPTGLTPKSLKGQEAKVYDLIVKRFMATFGEWATRESMKLRLDVNGEVFVAEGKRTVDPAWHILYEPYAKQKESELPHVEKGEVISLREIELLDKETEPPKRYTPASVIKELEKRELGTKATRADIIESLFSRGYIQEESIQVTKIGMRTTETLEKYCPEILDEQLTRHFEEEMEKIRQKEMKRDEVLDESRKVLIEILKHFDENKEKIGEELKSAHRETLEEQSYLGPCPSCEGNLVIKQAKKSRKQFAACDTYPDCKTTFPLPQGALVKSAGKQCPECNHPMITLIRKGKRPQVACINPDCPSKNIDTSKLEKKECPKCGSELVVRKSVYGSFYGCSKYPECRYTEQIEQ